MDGKARWYLIDHGELAFARAEVATMTEVFEHVAVVGAPPTVDVDPAEREGGNLVAVGSTRLLDLEAIEAAITTRDTGWTAIGGDDVAAWVGDAQVLTDDHAPVDQCCSRTTSSRDVTGRWRQQIAAPTIGAP